jgi:large subunit ribosomal protein L18
MARNARYRLPYRRRREGKTNYHLRRKLVRTNKYNIRAVVRVSNSHALVQFVEARTNGDITHSIAHTRELSDYNWKAATSNLPSAYLIGLLAGFKARKAGITNAILDIGLNPPIYGSRVFAALKGIVDSGIDIPHSNKVFPDDNRLRGQHISEYAKLLKEKDEESFKKQFSNLISKNIDPLKIPQIFENIKNEIQAKYA